MQQARVLPPARLPCRFQPVPYAVGPVLVLAAGLVAPAPAARADPSGPWWTKDNGSIIKVAPCAAFYCGTLSWLRRSPMAPAARP
ncbi:MAG: hypothetical protein WBG11_03255 [Methylocella sp.]